MSCPRPQVVLSEIRADGWRAEFVDALRDALARSSGEEEWDEDEPVSLALVGRVKIALEIEDKPERLDSGTLLLLLQLDWWPAGREIGVEVACRAAERAIPLVPEAHRGFMRKCIRLAREALPSHPDSLPPGPLQSITGAWATQCALLAFNAAYNNGGAQDAMNACREASNLIHQMGDFYGELGRAEDMRQQADILDLLALKSLETP